MFSLYGTHQALPWLLLWFPAVPVAFDLFVADPWSRLCSCEGSTRHASTRPFRSLACVSCITGQHLTEYIQKRPLQPATSSN